MMAPSLDQGDIAYALNSIRTTGGCTHDADILEALLEDGAAPFLDDIRKGMATAKVADTLEELVWGEKPKPARIRHHLVRWGTRGAYWGESRPWYSVGIFSRNKRCFIWQFRSYDRHELFLKLRERIDSLRPGREIFISRNVQA